MYYLFFILYMTVGLALTLLALIWAVKKGQFRDQQRARYIPLSDDYGDSPVTVTRFHRYQAYVLFGLMLCGMIVSTIFIFYASG